MLFFAIGVFLFLYESLDCPSARATALSPKDSSPGTEHSQEPLGAPRPRASRIVSDQYAGEIAYPILRRPMSQEKKHKQHSGHKTHRTAD
jgi:hypothetical protein